MNEHDIFFYHIMLNVELKLFVNNMLSTIKNDNNFSRFVVKEFKQLKHNKKITLSVFKNFYDIFRPSSKGFKSRWSKKLERYQEIYDKNAVINNKNNIERLQLFMSELARYNFIVKFGHDDEIEFSPSESDMVLPYGFVGIHSDDLIKVENKSHVFSLTYYIGECGVKGETMLIYHLQNFGFNIALDLLRSQDRLAHKTFSTVSIESFHEKLSFAGGINHEG